jgi:hypothetical protein
MSSLLETCVATHGAEFSINLLGCINEGTEAVSVGGAIYRRPSAIRYMVTMGQLIGRDVAVRMI